MIYVVIIYFNVKSVILCYFRSYIFFWQLVDIKKKEYVFNSFRIGMNGIIFDRYKISITYKFSECFFYYYLYNYNSS